MIRMVRVAAGRATRCRWADAGRRRRTSCRRAIDELRELARGIHPAILTERGLGPAISSLAERSPVPVVVDVPARRAARRPSSRRPCTSWSPRRWPTSPSTPTRPRSTVEVTGSAAPSVALEVSDDGVGGCDRSPRHRDPRAGRPGLGGRRDPGRHQPAGPGHPPRLPTSLSLPSARRTDVAPAQQRPTQPLGAGQ